MDSGMIRIKKDIKQTVLKALEWLGIIITMHYCLYCFFCASTFYFDFTALYHTITFTAIVVIGCIRVVVSFVAEIKSSTSPNNRKHIILKYALIILSIIPCVLITKKFGYKDFVYIPFIIFCLSGIDIDRVLKCFAICIGTILAATILCALSGSITNLVYLGQGKGRVRGSYGIAYPTDFASYLIYLLLFVWAIQKKHSIWHTSFFAGIALITTWIIYTYPHSETSTLCGVFTTIVIIFEGLDHSVLFERKSPNWISKITDFVTIGLFPILGLIFFGLTWCYGKGIRFALQANEWMSSRLAEAWNAIQKYGIHALGAATPQEGGGHSLIQNANYEFLDSTFGLILIRYGWILALFLTAMWVWMTWRALKKGNKRLALVFALIAIHSFSEHHFPELNFNILLATPLCIIPNQYKQTKNVNKGNNTEQTKQTGLAKILSVIIMAGIILTVMLLLPRVVSWLRAFIDMNGWTGGGTNSLKALLICLAGLGGLAGVCWLLCRIVTGIIKEKKISWTPVHWLIAIGCIMAIGIRWTNDKIQNWTSKYEARLTADAAAIYTTLSVAEEPVYADQIEEAYKRRFSGFSDRLFSPEELAKSGKGTILVEKNIEEQQLIGTGALYCQISDYTGLYTYDDGVAQTLSKAGYRVHGYYDTKRYEDLVAFAPMNGLLTTETGGVMLWGEEHSLVFGPYLTQYSGSYLTTFELDIDPIWLTDNREICTLRVAARWGQDILAEKTIRANDFAPDNTIKVSLAYNTSDKPGVEYLVFAKDDIPMNVRRISWKRNNQVDTRRKYTSDGYVQSEKYYNENGEPYQQAAGYYGIAYEYGNRGELILVQYLDENGDPTIIQDGYAQIAREYNERKQITLEKYLDEEGLLYLREPQNYAVEKRIYNHSGQLIGQSYYDANDQPTIMNSGYAEIRYQRDDKGRTIKEAYYDDLEKPIVLGNAYAAVEYGYDDAGNVTCYRYFGADEKPALTCYGYAELHRIYDEQKRIIHEEYYGENGQPYTQPGGYTAISQTYEGEHLLSRVYLNSEGQRVDRIDGYSEARWVTDEDGITRNLVLTNLNGDEISQDRINYMKDIQYDVSEWSGWMIPNQNVINITFNIGTATLGKRTIGSEYTCHLEIEFSGVTQTEEQEFGFWTQGAADGKWNIGNIWDSRLVKFTKPPADGIYSFTSTTTLNETLAKVNVFNIGFRCDNWASGKFRVRHVKIEQGSEATEWTPGI